MKKNLLFIATILIVAASSCVKDRLQPAPKAIIVPTTDTLMYYWSFNNNDTIPDFSIAGSTGVLTYSAAYADYTAGSDLNLINGTDSGVCLRVRNPSQSLSFKLPTTGYKNVILSFAVQSSSSGPSQDAISYTTDGTNYITTALTNPAFSVSTTFQLVSFDFSSDPNVNNNPKFAVKITFDNNNTGTSGNDRFDNVSLSGLRE